MDILCKTKDELKKVLEKLEKDGCKWNMGQPAVEWGMENLYTPVMLAVIEKDIRYGNNIDNYENYVTAEKFLSANDDLNTEKEAEATGEKLINEVEFDEAVVETIRVMFEDPEIKGMAKVMMSLIGSLFAKRIKYKLFREDNE